MEAEVGIRSWSVTGVQTCPLPISVPIRPRIPTPTQRVSSHLGRDGCSAALCSCGVNAGLLPILLLVGSNLFMTLTWYGHLRFKEVPGAACAQLPSLRRSCGDLDSPKLARRGGQTSGQMAVRLHSRLHPG